MTTQIFENECLLDEIWTFYCVDVSKITHQLKHFSISKRTLFALLQVFFSSLPPKKYGRDGQNLFGVTSVCEISFWIFFLHYPALCCKDVWAWALLPAWGQLSNPLSWTMPLCLSFWAAVRNFPHQKKTLNPPLERLPSLLHWTEKETLVVTAKGRRGGEER